MENSFDPVESVCPDSVKLVSFINGMNIITQVVEYEDGNVIAMLPMEIMPEHDEETAEMRKYELVPYLEHMYPFDIGNPIPVFFNQAMIMSVCVPTVHLFRNYYLTLKIMQSVDDEEKGYIRESTQTMH